MVGVNRVTLADVRRTYPAAQIALHKLVCPYEYYVLGKVSLWLTPPFVNRGFSANAVTCLSLAVEVVALGVTVLGAFDPLAFAAAGLLVHAVYVLDNIDGHVARFLGTASLVGGLFDALVTWVHKALFPLALGLALTLGDAGSIPFIESTGPAWIWIAAGGVRSFAFLFMVALGRKVDALLADRSGGVQPAGSPMMRVGRTLEEIEPVLLILAVPVGMVGLLHILYVGFYVLCLAAVVAISFRRLRRADETPVT